MNKFKLKLHLLINIIIIKNINYFSHKIHSHQFNKYHDQ